MIKHFGQTQLDRSFIESSNTHIESCDIDFKDIRVEKPWGYEYLLFENSECAIWVLRINYQQNTSMHCHMQKDTALVCLQGLVSSNTLSTNNLLSPLDAVFFEKQVFHQTNVLSEGGTLVLEVETPVNKYDLVRINDQYGRRGQDYEDKRFFKPQANLTLDVGQTRCLGNLLVVIESIEVMPLTINSQEICIPLEGAHAGKILQDQPKVNDLSGQSKVLCLRISENNRGSRQCKKQ